MWEDEVRIRRRATDRPLSVVRPRRDGWYWPWLAPVSF